MQPLESDSEIQREVLDELRWDTRIDETDVGVEVDDGIVTLTGTVDSWARRVAAQEAAHRVQSVRDVANDIQVKLPGVGAPTDTEVARAVRDALVWDVMVPDTRIHTTVSEGVVTLTGTVEFPSHRADAERAIKNLVGVCHIVNRIEVRGPAVSPASIRRAIEDALERRAERVAGKVSLDVTDGKVVVSGTINSWRERSAIIGAALSTPGVKSVDDHLVVMV